MSKFKIVNGDPDHHKHVGHFGGNIADVPKPHIYLWDHPTRKRRVRVRILVYTGAGHHYHVSLRQESDGVWCRRVEPPYTTEPHWRECWDDAKAKGLDLSEKFNTMAEAAVWIRKMKRKYFPPKTHVLVDDIYDTRWYYRDGD
jgi:hypothetical protein